MAFYIAGKKTKLHCNGAAYILHMVLPMPTVTVCGLMSADGYCLQDTTGTYLLPKDGET